MKKVLGQLPPGSDLSGIILNGQVTGNAEVVSGTATINGMICGDLVIREGAALELNGLITGNLIVEGYAAVYGVIGGVVKVKKFGRIEVSPSARCTLHE
jgi:cytoskeletal protein CcmA (bactofilin family)